MAGDVENLHTVRLQRAGLLYKTGRSMQLCERERWMNRRSLAARGAGVASELLPCHSRSRVHLELEQEKRGTVELLESTSRYKQLFDF